MGQPVVHFQIAGKEPLKLGKFYEDLFQWKLAEPMPEEMGSYTIVDESSSGLGGGIGASPDGKPRVTFYVEVPDLQVALDQAVAMGGTVVRPPLDMPGIVAMAEFADPEGNVIGLVKG